MALKTYPRSDNLPATRQPNPSEAVDVAKEKENFLTISQKEAFYSVSNKQAPTARIVREWAKAEGINYKVLEYGKDENKAWAKVAAWKGDFNNPEAYAEEPIVHVFSHLLVEATFDAIANGLKVPTGRVLKNNWGKSYLETKDYFLTKDDWEIGAETHWPKITNPLVQFQLLRNHLGKIKTIERDAVTKAERRAEYKILTKIGRIKEDEQPEVEGEKEEPTDIPGEPETLEDTLSLIRTGLLKLADDSREEAQKKLTEIAAKINPHVPISRLNEITTMEQAEEILSRVRQALIEKEKQ